MKILTRDQFKQMPKGTVFCKVSLDIYGCAGNYTADIHTPMVLDDKPWDCGDGVIDFFYTELGNVSYPKSGIDYMDGNKYQFMLSSLHPFATEHVSGLVSSYNGELVLVGIYDANGKMTEKFEIWLDLVRDSGYKDLRTRDAGFMSTPVGQKKKVRKIFEALRSGVGYVRIVAPRYDNSDFDIKIFSFRE